MRRVGTRLARAFAVALLLAAMVPGTAVAGGPVRTPRALTPIDPGYPQAFTPVDPGYPQVLLLATPVDPGYPR